MKPPFSARLPQLGVLRLTGPDAHRFLQGQLSNDLDLLAAGRPLRAGLHNPQGRVIAVLQLFALDADVLAVLPRDLAERVRLHLSRYVLRAKVRIEDVSDTWAVYGSDNGQERRLQVLPADAPLPEDGPRAAAEWLAGDIAAGLPQVHTATSERFVAQMLNLDRVDGISFSKGCYTGQEVIARAHYRGRVKRRMQRFVSQDPRPIYPGDRIRIAGGPGVDVIEATRLPDGTLDFLAVAPLAGAGADDADDPGNMPRIEAQPAALPYLLEDA
jgi:tRNA-modifying protein YgfZ